VLGKQRCAAIDPTSVLHKRPQRVAGFLDARHISRRSRPLADCLVVGLAIACTTDHDSKGVRIHISLQPGKFEGTTHQFLGPMSPVVTFDNRKHSSQIPVDRITITSLLKIIPSIADIPEPLSN
jgi:hypothetical protein